MTQETDYFAEAALAQQAVERCEHPRDRDAVRCRPCYFALRRANARANLEARFWSKVDQSGDCWLWKASRGTTGYGQFQLFYQGRWLPMKAPRVAYLLTHGGLPDDRLACHHCDTPLCVRPDHLYMGTHADNMRDRLERGKAK